MSAQELRDILEAELAELSDCDGSDVTDDLDQSYTTEKFRDYENVGDICNDEEEASCLDNVEEWQELMSSAAQVEERIQGMMISLSDNFESLIYSRVDDVGREMQIPDAQLNRSDTISSSAVELCCSSAINSARDHPLRTTQSDRGSNILSISYCEHEQVDFQEFDMITFEELKDLMNFIIEAVERSAPINTIQLPKIGRRTIDLSSLPQEIKDENDDHIRFIGEDGHIRHNQEMKDKKDDHIRFIGLDGRIMDISESSHSESSDFIKQSQQSIINERALNATADILRHEAVVASERIQARKEVLWERKRIMEEELRTHRVEVASVRIQCKYRQWSQKKKYLALLETHMTERRSKEKEDEILKRAMMLELIRVQRLEEERNEEYRREQEQEQRVLAEGAKRLDEISFKRMEVEKERLENLEMAEMETLSMRALEFEKITNLLLDIEEANCILCETCCKRRLTKKKRKRKKKLLCHPHDPVLIEEANVEDEFSDVRMNSQYNFSEQELFDKQQQIDSMGNYWLTESHSFIAECKGKELLHGIVAPAREDLLRVLGVELQTLSQNILTTAVDVDRETNEKQLQLPFGDRHETPMDDLQLRGEEVDEPLLQALNCWQKWVKSTGLTARGDRIKSEISVTANSPIVSKGEINSMIPGLGLCSLADEEINQLLSFGLRPLKLSEPDISYQEISLTVESLTDCAFLRTFTQLQRLHLNVNKLRTLVGLEHMMSLEELSIKDNALCALNNIGKLTSLRSLSVDDNSLNAQGLAALSDLRNLHTLSANTNKLHTFPYLAGCHGLQRLHLYHNSISLISTSSLTPLCSLMHLDLGRNKLEIISGAALSQCPLLQTLVLSQNLLTSPPSPLYLPNLRTMWLSGNKLHDLQSWLPYKDPREMKDPGSDSTCRNSDGLIWPLFIPMIEKLHFSDNLLTKIDAGAVCNMPLLVDLDISFNSVQTTLGLDGLRFLSKLTSLQIHDNPIYSTSGGSGAERNELTCWLVHECPSLRVVSGNVLQKVDHPTPPRVSVAEFGNVGASAPPTAFGTNNSSSAAPDPVKIDSPVSSARYREVLLADFRKTGKWSAAASLDLSFHYQSRIKEVLAPTIVYTGRDGLTLSKLSNISLLSKKFVQTLLVLNYDQNVLKAREKIENIRAKYPANVLINLADKVELGVEQKKRFYWETALVQQLDDHTRRLLAWSGNSITTCDLPIVMMAKFQTPIEDEEVGVVIDQIRDICNTSDIPHPEVIHSAAAERMHNVTSLPTASSVPVDSSDYLYLPTTVPSGISRLQAVWRSRKIRARVRSVLLASRYQDDELDELFGGVGFDLDEALTLQGYEEYLAPVVLEKGWEGGQNSIFTNNSDNGWVDGEMGRGSHSKVGTYHQYESRMDDNEDGSFATQGVSVVYGDHKRKKSNQRVEAASFYRTHDSDNGQRTYNVAANLLSCQTESNDSLSRPSSSRTETSSLSGASLQTRADPDSYRSMLSIRTRGCSSDIADSEATKVNEWGIKDPKVLQAMMKRNKRMSGFAASQDNKSEVVEAEARCYRTAKNARSGSQPSTTMSWGGGGAAGVSTSTGSGRGRGRMGGGGRTKGWKAVPPAWALAAAQEQG